MEELIAKSKSFKAEKQKQRDEDLEETEALDEQFKGLLEGQALLRLMKPKGSKASTAGTDSQVSKLYVKPLGDKGAPVVHCQSACRLLKASIKVLS